MKDLWVALGVVFFLDQISKVLVLRWLDLDALGVFDVVPPYLRFHMAWNRGVNFGLFADDGSMDLNIAIRT
ncbi:MAG: signal peptidase II, partial [Paracoccaceae bacterium]